MNAVEIHVPGMPVPQGSKRVVPTKGGPRAIEGNETRLRPWRATIAAGATYAMDGAEPFHGPVRVEVVFAFPRPHNHFGTGKNQGMLKAAAPYYRDQAPDLDKLLRAVFDGLAGICFRNDAQVVSVTAAKVYGSPCARITVMPTPTRGG